MSHSQCARIRCKSNPFQRVHRCWGPVAGVCVCVFLLKIILQCAFTTNSSISSCIKSNLFNGFRSEVFRCYLPKTNSKGKEILEQIKIKSWHFLWSSLSNWREFNRILYNIRSGGISHSKIWNNFHKKCELSQISANVNKFVQIWHQLIDQIHCANRNRLKYAVKSKRNSAKTKGQHICSKMMD